MSVNCNNQLVNTTTFILNAFIHVTLIFSFLTFLFINIIAPLSMKKFHEEIDKIVEQQINTAIPNKIDLTDSVNAINNRQKLIGDLKNAFLLYYSVYNQDPTQVITEISIFETIVDYIINTRDFYYQNILDVYSSENYLVKNHNDYVINNAYYLSIILMIISTVIIISDKLSDIPCINLTKLFTENILTFACVGCIEYWFFINYAFKYSPAQPSLLINSIINDMKMLL
jgi:hypothetical protein